MRPLILPAVLLLMAAHLPLGASLMSTEMARASRWTAAKFEGKQDEAPAQPGLLVLANNDPVQLNSRAGRPLNIAGKQYRRGLYCHAVSRVVVRLPGPAARFEAIAGVDTNEQTSGGRGSVVFVVSTPGAPSPHSGPSTPLGTSGPLPGGEGGRWRSPLMREGMAGVPVSLPLNGATELVLEVEDGGDGIACDQADWAEARVSLADGSTLCLGDLPLLDSLTTTRYTGEPPFSFTYGGKPSAELLPGWQVQRSSRPRGRDRTEHTVTYTDPQTGLAVRVVAVAYHTYPTVEWTVYLRNTGSADTPLIADLLALDTSFERTSSQEWVLHHHVGSPCQANDYQPLADGLAPGADLRITTSGGRSSNSDFPYFDLESGNEGVLVAVGWPGQWAAQFTRDRDWGVRLRAGQELTHFVLHPGEEVRTPLVALQFYQRGRLPAHNVWRRWMLECNLPRPHGQAVPPAMAACSSHQFGEMIHADSASQKFFVDRYLEEKLPLDYWWMDAGWYVNESGWPNTGTWEVDEKRFPGGLRPISDHAHAKGVKTIVWFEPERVTPGTWLYGHPDWLLGKDGEQKLLNLGDPQALEWLIGHVNGLIDSQGIDLYRNDFNIDPLPYWRGNDAADRQGITEIRYVEGFLAYWDALRAKHPDMLIDTCASGGRRNDLETLRRSVPLLRSDYILEPVGQQNHTYGLAFWVPFFGTGINSADPYVYRSQMCPHLTACYDMRNRDYDYASVRTLTGQWQQVAPYMLGDYYPLTPYSLANDAWMAWQFDRPDLGGGVVQAFRRSDSVYEAARFRLQGLDPAATYEVRDLDQPRAKQMTGKELAESGLPVAIGKQPGAVVITYRKARSE